MTDLRDLALPSEKHLGLRAMVDSCVAVVDRADTSPEDVAFFSGVAATMLWLGGDTTVGPATGRGALVATVRAVEEEHVAAGRKMFLDKDEFATGVCATLEWARGRSTRPPVAVNAA